MWNTNVSHFPFVYEFIMICTSPSIQVFSNLEGLRPSFVTFELVIQNFEFAAFMSALIWQVGLASQQQTHNSQLSIGVFLKLAWYIEIKKMLSILLKCWAISPLSNFKEGVEGSTLKEELVFAFDQRPKEIQEFLFDLVINESTNIFIIG